MGAWKDLMGWVRARVMDYIQRTPISQERAPGLIQKHGGSTRLCSKSNFNRMVGKEATEGDLKGERRGCKIMERGEGRDQMWKYSRSIEEGGITIGRSATSLTGGGLWFVSRGCVDVVSVVLCVQDFDFQVKSPIRRNEW